MKKRIQKLCIFGMLILCMPIISADNSANAVKKCEQYLRSGIFNNKGNDACNKACNHNQDDSSPACNHLSTMCFDHNQIPACGFGCIFGGNEEACKKLEAPCLLDQFPEYQFTQFGTCDISCHEGNEACKKIETACNNKNIEACILMCGRDNQTACQSIRDECINGTINSEIRRSCCNFLCQNHKDANCCTLYKKLLGDACINPKNPNDVELCTEACHTMGSQKNNRFCLAAEKSYIANCAKNKKFKVCQWACRGGLGDKSSCAIELEICKNGKIKACVHIVNNAMHPFYMQAMQELAQECAKNKQNLQACRRACDGGRGNRSSCSSEFMICQKGDLKACANITKNTSHPFYQQAKQKLNPKRIRQ